MRTLEDMPEVKVVITTSFGRLPDVVVPAKWEWTQRWLPWFRGFDFITIHHKWLLSTDMIVDDFHNNIEKWMKHHPGAAVLVSRPWNASNRERLQRRGAILTTNGVGDIIPIVEEQLEMQRSLHVKA
jgi:5'(3')-deoxyribonucleotidase